MVLPKFLNLSTVLILLKRNTKSNSYFTVLLRGGWIEKIFQLRKLSIPYKQKEWLHICWDSVESTHITLRPYVKLWEMDPISLKGPKFVVWCVFVEVWKLLLTCPTVSPTFLSTEIPGPSMTFAHFIWTRLLLSLITLDVGRPVSFVVGPAVWVEEWLTKVLTLLPGLIDLSE